MWWYGTRCLLLLVLVLPAFQPAAAAVDIAAYYHFTGTYAQFHGADGWGFWARYVNDTYGGLLVGGKREPINLHTWDDKSNLTVVKGLFQMFVDKGYKFVIGGHTTRADLSGSFFDPHKVVYYPCSARARYPPPPPHYYHHHHHPGQFSVDKCFSFFSVKKRRPPTTAVGSPPTVIGCPPTAIGCPSSAIQLCAYTLRWLPHVLRFIFFFSF